MTKGKIIVQVCLLDLLLLLKEWLYFSIFWPISNLEEINVDQQPGLML